MTAIPLLPAAGRVVYRVLAIRKEAFAGAIFHPNAILHAPNAADNLTAPVIQGDDPNGQYSCSGSGCAAAGGDCSGGECCIFHGGVGSNYCGTCYGGGSSSTSSGNSSTGITSGGTKGKKHYGHYGAPEMSDTWRCCSSSQPAAWCIISVAALWPGKTKFPAGKIPTACRQIIS